MVTEAEMRALLVRYGAKARHTADRTYWYHRRWANGLPLGLAYVEIEKEAKRQAAREEEIRVLKSLGWRHRQDKTEEGGLPAGWAHPNHPGRHTRKGAYALALREFSAPPP